MLVPDQSQIGLVNESRGIQGVTGGFGSHASGGEFPQLVVDEREQFSRGLTVTGLCGFE